MQLPEAPESQLMYYLGMRSTYSWLLCLLVAAFFCCPEIISAQDDSSGLSLPASAESEVLVKAEGFTLNRSEVEKAAAGKMKEVELEALRAPARIEVKRHEILNQSMQELTAEKLLQMESEKRGITKQELVELKITPRALPLTEEELESLYELNKNRLKGSREEIIAQITSFVSGQRTREARIEYTRELAEEYKVEYRLPPLRFNVTASGHPSLGPEDAPITIVEFSDFECPHCANAGKELHRLFLEFEGKIRIVFRQYPLWMIHEKAWKAAEASLCAAEQGKFWEMHNLLFEGQDKLDDQGLKEKAAQLGLDQERFNSSLDSGKFSDAVELDLVEGSKAGVSGTPAFFINGRPLEERFSFESARKIVLEELEQTENPE